MITALKIDIFFFQHKKNRAEENYYYFIARNINALNIIYRRNKGMPHKKIIDYRQFKWLGKKQNLPTLTFRQSTIAEMLN